MFKLLKTGLKIGIGYYIFKELACIFAMVGEMNLMFDAKLTNEEVATRLNSAYPFYTKYINSVGMDDFINIERYILEEK